VNDDDDRSPSERLPDDIVDRLDELDYDELDATVAYAQSRIRELHRPLVEDIRAAVDEEELVDVTDNEGYAVVRRRHEGDDVASLYVVTHEKGMDGEIRLHWSLVDDTAGDAE